MRYSHFHKCVRTQVFKDSLVQYDEIVSQHGLITKVLGLQLSLDARHFQDGPMRVKCVANISPVLWHGGQESVVRRRPQPEIREAMLLGEL